MNRDEIRQRIAERAYSFFVARGYQHGYDVEDWLRAEREILAELGNCEPNEPTPPEITKTTRKRTTTKKTGETKTTTRRKKKDQENPS